MIGIILLTAALGATSIEVEVRAVEAEPVVGSLVELSPTGVTVETPQGRKTFAIERLLSISSLAAAPAPAAAVPVWVQLIDGSELAASDITIDGPAARLQRPSGALDVSTDAVKAVCLQPASPATDAEWKRLLETSSATDRLVVRQGDLLNYHHGVLGDVTDQRVQFKLDDETLAVSRAKVYGFIFARPPSHTMAKTICRLSEADGSRWNVAELALDSAGLTVKTPSGLSAVLPREALGRIDFSEGKIVFLSDLAPAAVRVTPFLGDRDASADRVQFLSPREDRAIEPGPLRLDGKTFARGLALHSRTEVEYLLPGEFARFQATMGIDDGVRPRGDVRLIVSGDGRELFSATILGAEPARAIDLDVTGVRRLSILVDFGGDLDVGDHLDLCDARIVK